MEGPCADQLVKQLLLCGVIEKDKSTSSGCSSVKKNQKGRRDIDWRVLVVDREQEAIWDMDKRMTSRTVQFLFSFGMVDR